MHHPPLAALLAAILSAGLVAQRGVTEASARKIPAWREAVAWVDSLHQAKQRAAKQGGLLFAYQKGVNRHCPRCRRVEQRVLATDAFVEFARTVIPVCIRSDVKAPRFVFLDAKGRELGAPAEPTVAAFAKTRDALAVLRHLATVRQPTPAHKAARFVAELQLRRLSLARARAVRDQLALDEAQRRTATREIATLLVQELLARARKARDYSQLGAAFAAMHARGEEPTGRVDRVYWSLLMQHARANQDAALFATAYTRYRELLGESARLRRLFRRYDAILAELSHTK